MLTKIKNRIQKRKVIKLIDKYARVLARERILTMDNDRISLALERIMYKHPKGSIESEVSYFVHCLWNGSFGDTDLMNSIVYLYYLGTTKEKYKEMINETYFLYLARHDVEDEEQ